MIHNFTVCWKSRVILEKNILGHRIAPWKWRCWVASIEGRRIEAPRHWVGWCPLPSHLEGLGEHHAIPSWSRVEPRPETHSRAEEGHRTLLFAWLSGRTSVSGQHSFAILRLTCSWWVTTYVGKLYAIGQPTRPTQPFILSGSINE